MTGDPWPNTAYHMRIPFTAAVPLRSGLGRSGVGGNCPHCCACADQAPLKASRKMRERKYRLDIDSIELSRGAWVNLRFCGVVGFAWSASYITCGATDNPEVIPR